jgi:hypothetical protein
VSGRTKGGKERKVDERGDDVSKDRDADDGLDDATHGGADHMRDGAGHLDRQEAGDADEEAKDALQIRSNATVSMSRWTCHL